MNNYFFLNLTIRTDILVLFAKIEKIT